MSDITPLALWWVEFHLMHRMRRPVVTPATLFAEIHMDGVERSGIGNDIECAFNVEFTDAEIEGWGSVADVAASVALHLAVPV